MSIKSPSLATIAIAGLFLLGAGATGRAQTTVTTDPVGFHTLTINPGYQTVGLPLVRTAVTVSSIASNTGSVITLSSSATNVGSLLQSGSAYYVEVVSGTDNSYVGDRFDVDFNSTVASANNTVTINTSSANNTIPGTLPNLAGWNVVLRPHMTIGYVFGSQGTSQLQGSTVVSNADQVQIYNTTSGGFDTYFLLASGTIQQWRKVGGGSTVYDNQPIPPGTGLFLNRAGTSTVSVTVVGGVRVSGYGAQPIGAGYNLISEEFPVDRSPASRGFTVANGFTGSTVVSNADQIQVWNGTGFDTYYLLVSGTIQQWRKVGGGTTDYMNTNIFGFDKSVFVKSNKANLSYASSKPF